MWISPMVCCDSKATHGNAKCEQGASCGPVGPDSLISDVLNKVYAESAWADVIKISRAYGVKWDLLAVVFKLNQ